MNSLLIPGGLCLCSFLLKPHHCGVLKWLRKGSSPYLYFIFRGSESLEDLLHRLGSVERGWGLEMCIPSPHTLRSGLLHSLSCSQKPELVYLYLWNAGTTVPHQAENEVAYRFPDDIISSSGQEQESYCSVSSNSG